MEARQFVSVYPSVIDEDRWRRDSCSELLRPAREWSNAFGAIIHQALRDPDNLPDVDAHFFDRFRTWVDDESPKLAQQLSDETRLEDRPAAANELNTLALTRASLSMWEPLLHGRWDPIAPAEYQITRAQETVALNGVQVSERRQKIATDYYTKWPSRKRSVEGIMGEFEAEVATLEAVKQMNADAQARGESTMYTVLPAPYQFEHGLNRSHNTDLLVIKRTESDMRVTGIQVKSDVLSTTGRAPNGGITDYLHYDMTRMTMLYAIPDLNSGSEVAIPLSDGKLRQFKMTGAFLCAEVARDAVAHGPVSQIVPIKDGHSKHKPQGTPPFDDAKHVMQGKFRGLAIAGRRRSELPRGARFVRMLLESRLEDAA